jgi:hypothetical protein
VAVFSRLLLILLLLGLLIAVPADAKKHETGFLDRTISFQAVNYKYQVFVPQDWTPRQKSVSTNGRSDTHVGLQQAAERQSHELGEPANDQPTIRRSR